MSSLRDAGEGAKVEVVAETVKNVLPDYAAPQRSQRTDQDALEVIEILQAQWQQQQQACLALAC